MINRVRALAIRSLAREKLVERDSMRLPVKPKLYAEQLGIIVQPFHPPDVSVSGFLMRIGNSFGIGYSTAIKSPGFQNFTVGHELGHFFIDDHPMAVLAEGKHFSHSGYISKDRFEQEADAFATEFLMPWKLIDPLIKRSPRGFASIRELADACESSFVASAIRYTEVTQESVAVIVSLRGIIEFMTASETFRQIRGIEWLRRGDSVPCGVPSSRLAQDPSWTDSCTVVQEGSYLSDWFPSAPRHDVEEDVIGLGSYQRMLTILLTDCEKNTEEEEETVSDDYIERWKEGRFRT